MPLEQSLTCPFCLSTAELKKEKFKHIPSGKSIPLVGYWYVYECLNCIERFTTTASDEESMNTLQKKCEHNWVNAAEKGKDVWFKCSLCGEESSDW